ncbi:MAG: GNAT family N-acetyltransferase [Oligoflexia bacterium]|nr:GNAT family N-acetyltransferase [Oligoflexia bacterium]
MLIAYIGSTPVGYKIGYELSSKMFYSWIGGVIPKYRRKGFAKKLMKIQHEIVSNEGYSIIRTSTENKFKHMLILNLKSGFNIIGSYCSDLKKELTIMLEKKLC